MDTSVVYLYICSVFMSSFIFCYLHQNVSYNQGETRVLPLGKCETDDAIKERGISIFKGRVLPKSHFDQSIKQSTLISAFWFFKWVLSKLGLI